MTSVEPLAREAAARLLASLDDIDSREVIVVEMLEQFDDHDERLSALGWLLALTLDALRATASVDGAASVIGAQVAQLTLNRTERRALRRGK